MGLNYVNWEWEDEQPVTSTETFDHDSFGHPSIIFDEETKGLVSYVIDAV